MSSFFKGLLLLWFFCVMLFFAIWFCLVGGIHQLEMGINANPDNVGDIIWGVIRILLAPTAAVIAIWIGAIFGVVAFWND